MIIKELVQAYKDTDLSVDEFIKEVITNRETVKDIRDESHSLGDIDDTRNYLKKRKELLDEAYSSRWASISRRIDLPVEFIREFCNYLDWNELSYFIPYDEDLLDEFANRVNWKVLFMKYHFSKDFLYRNQDRIRTVLFRECE